eukprot:g20041.t1
MAMTTDEMVFIFCSNGVFIPWLALMIAPKWKWTSPMTMVAVLISCVVYTYYFGAHLLNSKDVLGTYAEMGTLDGVAKLFSDSGILLPAWVHYLAFDLMVGHYLVQKNIADANGLSKLAMAPCLFFNCMAGPVGVLLYVILRAASSLVSGKPMGRQV